MMQKSNPGARPNDAPARVIGSLPDGIKPSQLSALALTLLSNAFRELAESYGSVDDDRDGRLIRCEDAIDKVRALRRMLPEWSVAFSALENAGKTLEIAYVAVLISSGWHGLKTVKEQFTYIARNPSSGLIKIGKTFDVDARMRSLSTGAGCELDVLHVIKRDVEDALHERFAAIRAFGEWFSDDGQIKAYIQELVRIGGAA